MKCPENKELLMSGYIDGELPRKITSEIDRHLSECQECRGYLESVRNTAVIPFNGIKRVGVPEFIWNNIKVSIVSREPVHSNGFFTWIKFHKVVSAAVSAAAVFIVAATVFVSTSNKYSPVQSNGHETLYVESIDAVYGIESSETTHGFLDSAEEFLS